MNNKQAQNKINKERKHLEEIKKKKLNT